MLKKDEILERLAEIEARTQGVSPGPWRYREIDGNEQLVEGKEETIVYVEWLTSNVPKRGWEHKKRNLTFIAHARQDIPWLCGIVRRLLAQGEEQK